jgi:hypothetical protein
VNRKYCSTPTVERMKDGKLVKDNVNLGDMYTIIDLLGRLSDTSTELIELLDVFIDYGVDITKMNKKTLVEIKNILGVLQVNICKKKTQICERKLPDDFGFCNEPK